MTAVSVYNAKTLKEMSTISLSRRTAASVRISRTAVAISTAAIASVITWIGVAVGSDIIPEIAATVALTAIYAGQRKGGAK